MWKLAFEIVKWAGRGALAWSVGDAADKVLTASGDAVADTGGAVDDIGSGVNDAGTGAIKFSSAFVLAVAGWALIQKGK